MQMEYLYARINIFQEHISKQGFEPIHPSSSKINSLLTSSDHKTVLWKYFLLSKAKKSLFIQHRWLQGMTAIIGRVRQTEKMRPDRVLECWGNINMLIDEQMNKRTRMWN